MFEAIVDVDEAILDVEGGEYLGVSHVLHRRTFILVVKRRDVRLVGESEHTTWGQLQNDVLFNFVKEALKSTIRVNDNGILEAIRVFDRVDTILSFDDQIRCV